jgi:NTP pyrophosphatase (non-canonical NTP hydrolase)
MKEEKEEYLQEILKCETTQEGYFVNRLYNDSYRYQIESLLLGELAWYALNKPKNVNKPNFEDLNIVDILGHLVEEMHELTYEFKKETFDYERILSEIGDCAAMLCGMLAWIMAHKDDKKET